MQRDGVEIPRVLEKCAETIEMYGLDVTGIYRLSGTTSRIQRLKAKLEASELPVSVKLIACSLLTDSVFTQVSRRSISSRTRT